MNNKLSTANSGALSSSELETALVAYGRKTYARLLAEYSNRDLALEAVRSVLLEMYTAMKATGCTDPLEAMMYSRGKNYQDEYLKNSAGEELDLILRSIVEGRSGAEAFPAKEDEAAALPTPAPIHTEPQQPPAPAPVRISEPAGDPPAQAIKGKRSSNKGGFWSTLLIIFLVVMIIAALWFVVGFTMSMGLIPEVDLGYEWFNETVTFLF